MAQIPAASLTATVLVVKRPDGYYALEVDEFGNLPTSGGGGGGLPAGASTEAKQDAAIVHLSSMDTVIGANITGPLVLEASMQTALTTLQAISDGIGFADAFLESIDQKTPAIGQALAAGSVPVVLPAAQQSALAPLTLATSPHAVRLSNGAGFITPTTPADTQPVAVASLPLPTGAATSALQSTGNANLASIDGKLPSLGPKVAAGSVSIARPIALQSPVGERVPAASGVLKASTGRLVKVKVGKRASGTHYFQLHNATTTGGISTSTLALAGYAITGNGTEIVINFADSPWDFSSGIAWAMSSTQDTYTAVATNVTVDAQWE